MSSLYVRNEFKNFITSNSSEKLIDLTGEFDNIQDLVSKNGITSKDPWVGIQFIGADEVPVTVGSTNVQGKYRETGGVYLHVVAMAKLGATNGILSRGEVLRDLLRGQRIGNRIIVNSVTPINFGEGATLNFEGGYTSGSFLLDYEYEKDI